MGLKQMVHTKYRLHRESVTLFWEKNNWKSQCLVGVFYFFRDMAYIFLSHVYLQASVSTEDENKNIVSEFILLYQQKYWWKLWCYMETDVSM